MIMDLHIHPISTTSRPVMLFIAENDMSVASRTVDLMAGEDLPAPFLAINPNGLVPVLVDGTFLAESSAPCERRANVTDPEPRTRARLVLTAILLAAFTASTVHAEGAKFPPELDAVRSALAKYADPVVAVRDGYFSTLGCVYYRDGGMGIHFINPALLGSKPDPMKPQLLLYEPEGGKLRLVGAEWLIPLATGVKERPTLFGHAFDGPMEGHEPLMPKDLHRYDLHVWLFKENPAGTFAVVNPTVRCDGYDYAFPEEPPVQVAQLGAY